MQQRDEASLGKTERNPGREASYKDSCERGVRRQLPLHGFTSPHRQENLTTYDNTTNRSTQT